MQSSNSNDFHSSRGVHIKSSSTSSCAKRNKGRRCVACSCGSRTAPIPQPIAQLDYLLRLRYLYGIWSTLCDTLRRQTPEHRSSMICCSLDPSSKVSSCRTIRQLLGYRILLSSDLDLFLAVLDDGFRFYFQAPEQRLDQCMSGWTWIFFNCSSTFSKTFHGRDQPIHPQPSHLNLTATLMQRHSQYPRPLIAHDAAGWLSGGAPMPRIFSTSRTDPGLWIEDFLDSGHCSVWAHD